MSFHYFRLPQPFLYPRESRVLCAKLSVASGAPPGAMEEHLENTGNTRERYFALCILDMRLYSRLQSFESIKVPEYTT